MCGVLLVCTGEYLVYRGVCVWYTLMGFWYMYGMPACVLYVFCICQSVCNICWCICDVYLICEVCGACIHGVCVLYVMYVS